VLEAHAHLVGAHRQHARAGAPAQHQLAAIGQRQLLRSVARGAGSARRWLDSGSIEGDGRGLERSGERQGSDEYSDPGNSGAQAQLSGAREPARLPVFDLRP
jgi:hypothetical protein